jgi:hypothetical protein
VGQQNPYVPSFDPSIPSARHNSPVGKPDLAYDSRQPGAQSPRRSLSRNIKQILGGLFSVLVALAFLGSLGSHNNSGTNPGTVDPQAADRVHELITNAIPDPELIADNSQFVDDEVDANGTIQNKGKAATTDLRVKVTVYDGSRVIGTGEQDLGALAPGEQRSYSFVVHLASSPDQVNTQTVWKWAADMCPLGSIPAPDPTDTTAQFCNNTPAAPSSETPYFSRPPAAPPQ